MHVLQSLMWREIWKVFDFFGWTKQELVHVRQTFECSGIFKYNLFMENVKFTVPFLLLEKFYSMRPSWNNWSNAHFQIYACLDLIENAW